MDSSDSEASASKKRFKCTKTNCSASFSKNSRLIWHERKHTGERPFVCDEEGCDKTYTNSSHLRRHKNVSHSEKKSEDAIVCSHKGCGAILGNKYALKKHTARKHSLREHPFNCNECEEGFQRKRQLQQHMLVHSDETVFSCDKCDMNFTTSYKLRKHQRSHRVYHCDCGQIFHRWSVLLVHKKSCREPRYKCDVCNKTFSHLGNFETHKLSHKDGSEKSLFACPFSECERFYCYEKNLRYHINTFHKKIEQPSYKCTFANCQAVLKTKRIQKNHLQTHFQWKEKKERKIRRDAGKPKKSIVATLIGENLTDESVTNIHETIESAPPQTLEQDTNGANDVTGLDDPLLAECDSVLKLLHEKMISVR